MYNIIKFKARVTVCQRRKKKSISKELCIKNSCDIVTQRDTIEILITCSILHHVVRENVFRDGMLVQGETK